MQAFKRVIQSLIGAEQHVDKLETDLKIKLDEVRAKNREALESLRRMAQEMQWRIDNIEEREKLREGGER